MNALYLILGFTIGYIITSVVTYVILGIIDRRRAFARSHILRRDYPTWVREL